MDIMYIMIQQIMVSKHNKSIVKTSSIQNWKFQFFFSLTNHTNTEALFKTIPKNPLT